MIAWMLYCVAVAIVIAGAGRAAESLARVAGYRMRWIWVGALALTAFLTISSAVRRFDERAPLTLVATVRERAASPTVSDPSWIELAHSVAERAGRALDGAFAMVLRSIDRAVPSSAIKYAGVMWIALSLALAAAFAIVVHRFHRARRAWPRRRVHDVPVRVSPNVGPIVIGLVRPEIVVPRWLLHRADDEQRLAVAHEQEHLRARDPMLLWIAWTLVVLAPWNAALWYMVSRLRLAIELDCDARVLRRGATPRAYGSLLIEVAQNASPLTLSALGFADESSQLYHRILALRAPAASFARTRAALAVLATVTAVSVACRIAPPAPPAPPVAISSTPAIATPAPVEQAVVAEAAATPPRVRAKSSRAVAVKAAAKIEPTVVDTPVVRVASDSAVSAVTVRLDSVVRRTAPLLLIDGVKATMDAMHELDPKTIENVEILKGAAATATYGAEAERGVITITTKKQSPPPPR